jgi:hypothetical protein
MSTDDDEALTWAGDDVPATVGRRSAGTTGERDPLATSDESAVPSTGHPVPARAAGETGSVALVLLGLLAGVHLLYSVGWVLTIGPLQEAFRPVDLLGTAMFSLGLVAAAASPVVWFVSAFWFTRSRSSWQRIAVLVVGAVLLVPWPFVVGLR